MNSIKYYSFKFINIFSSKYTISSFIYYSINLISTLLLTYLCGIKIYGEYIYAISIFSIISYLTTFKIEIVISNVKDKKLKELYFTQQIYLIILISFVIAIFFSLLNFYINIFNLNLPFFLYLSFIFTFIASPAIIIVLNQKLLINGEYDKITLLRLIPNLIILFCQVIFLNYSKTFNSLILSTSFANFIFIVSIFLIHIKKSKIELFSYCKYIESNSKTILILIPSSFINTLNQQLPNIIINKFGGSYLLGSFSLINKIFGSPATIIGPFILERFKKEINRIVENGLKLEIVFNKIFKILLTFSITFFLISLVFYLFKFPQFIFLQNFNFNVLLLFLVFAFRFVVSPITYFFFFSKKVHFDLIVQIIHLILIIIFFNLTLKVNPIDYLNLIQIFIYIVYFFSIKKIIKDV